MTITAAAKQFVDTYYAALTSHRDQIAAFYASLATMPDGKSLPVIVWNGNIIPDPTSLQKMFQEQMQRAHYDAQSYDCHVLNPNYVEEGAEAGNATAGKNMSLLVTVSGSFKYGDDRSVPSKGFSENFVLIPNPAAANTRGKDTHHWVIQSQNFRLVA